MKQRDKPVAWIYQLGEHKALKENSKKSSRNNTKRLINSVIKISQEKLCITFYLGYIKTMLKRETSFAFTNINKLIVPRL